MTLIQKIQNLTWWTLDIKLKDILTLLNTKITEIENSPSGGTQDLQSVLNTGESANVGNSSVILLKNIGGNILSQISVNSDDATTSSSLIIQKNTAALSHEGTTNRSSFSVSEYGSPQIIYDKLDIEARTDLNFKTPVANTTISLPAKTIAGEYTLATLDDLPQVADDFVNDAAAAIGGIAVGNLYHTAGVVKIRLS